MKINEEKLNEVQQNTVNEILDILNKHHKCLSVRPTGFGKTKMSVDIMHHYDTIIFLYPFRNIANEVYKHDVNDINLYLYTYCKLRNLYKANNDPNKEEKLNTVLGFCNNENTLFIMDEAHFLGGDLTSIVIKYLMEELCPNANYLGLTATPDRTDKLEIKWHFFDGHITSRYTILDAINDGIFKESWYVYTPLNTESIVKGYYNKIDKMEISKSKKTQLKSKVYKLLNPQKSDITNLDYIIKNNIDKFENKKGYYRFILYFTTFKDIHNKKLEIEKAFRKVFPGYDINSIIVSSENEEYKNNVEEIPKLKCRKNRIDLIFNINMLTFGYHDKNITGVMMFRPTASDIIYTQEAGRTFSPYQTRRGIIFDFVENLDRSSGDNSYNILYSISEGSNDEDSLSAILGNSGLKLDDKTKELLEIDRLIKSYITEEFEEEVINAYINGLVDMEYCINKLHLHDKNDFNKVLRRYKSYGKAV